MLDRTSKEKSGCAHSRGAAKAHQLGAGSLSTEFAPKGSSYRVDCHDRKVTVKESARDACALSNGGVAIEVEAVVFEESGSNYVADAKAASAAAETVEHRGRTSVAVGANGGDREEWRMKCTMCGALFSSRNALLVGLGA